jgi:hypothetical protein
MMNSLFDIETHRRTELHALPASTSVDNEQHCANIVAVEIFLSQKVLDTF